MKKQPELTMMMDVESGKMFFEIDSLIAWFESETEPELKKIGEYAAYTLRGMKERSIKNPNRVMTEEEYHRKESAN